MATQPNLPDIPCAGQGHILIVDDETGIRTAMALVLELEGFQVTQAGDGCQGLHCLIECTPDLVISDYMMPRMNGVEMVRAIRARPEGRDLPVILLTAAFPTEPDYRELVDEFLMKPVDLDTLIDTMRMLIARNRPPR